MDKADCFDALLELTRRLSAERSLQSALGLVAEAALELLAGDHGSVRVLDHTRTELLCTARAGVGSDQAPAAFALGQGVLGWVMERGELARIGQAQRDDRFVDQGDQGFVVESILAAPLWSGGEIVGVLAVSSPERDAYGEDDEAVMLLLANGSVPAIEKARLSRLAVTDPQTMAFNDSYLARGLRVEIERAASEGGELSVLVMNLDLFKQVNDTHGRGSGDVVLRLFGDLVRAATREEDAVVRRRGDEFVLIMPNTATHDGRAVAERIRARLEAHRLDLGDGRSVAQTVSIGVASHDGLEAPERLEKRARAAMRTAKLHGRNRIHVDDEGSTAER